MSIPAKLCAISMNAVLYGGRDKQAGWREAAGRMEAAMKQYALARPDAYFADAAALCEAVRP